MPVDVDIKEIMSNAKTFKGTGFVVHRDFVREVRENEVFECSYIQNINFSLPCPSTTSLFTSGAFMIALSKS